MIKSLEEIHRLLDRLGASDTHAVHEGSRSYLSGRDRAYWPGETEGVPAPVTSPAAEDLVGRGMRGGDGGEPLYVITVGAPTNVASALLMEPELVKRLCVVWLGGHGLNWPDCLEFNLKQDIESVRVLFDSGVPLVLFPCLGVASHLQTSLAEIDACVRGRGAIGDYLAEIFREYPGVGGTGASKVLWDLACVAWLADPASVESALVPSPIVSTEFTWSIDSRRHLVRVANYIRRDRVFGDLFSRLSAAV